jgi:protein-disulfide isomerase
VGNPHAAACTMRHAGPVNRNRLYLLGGAALLAVVVVVIVVAVAGGGGGSSNDTTATSAAPPSTTLAGVHQTGDTLGSASAPATLTVFEDPQCPYCKQWNDDALPAVVRDYVRPGKIKLVYRGIEIIGPNSTKGLRAIYGAAQQNKVWNMVEGIYAQQGAENSGWITDDVIRQAAATSHANADAIFKAMPTDAVTAQLQRAGADAQAVGLQGTPTFILQRPLSEPQQLNAPLDGPGFEQALNAALQ